jgi:hypothetical protein
MADREWRGHWWLPGQDADAVPGTLVQRESDGELVLHLIGGFSIDKLVPVDEHQSAISIEPNFPMILGTCSGEPFTLLECQARHTSGAGFLSRAVSEQDIGVRRGLRGIHLTAPDEEVFDSAVLNVEYLLGWMQKTTFDDVRVELNEWKWTGHQTASTKPVADITTFHDGYEYTLGVVFNQFRFEDRPRANERSLANREWAELTIKSETPTTFAGFDRASKAIMDLMTLVAHAPAGVIREKVRFTPSEQQPARGRRTAEVEVMGRQIHQPKPGAKETARVDYLFTLEDIEFSEVLPKWLDLHERAWLACGILFGLSYIREGYTSSRLLSAATAAESLHRALDPDATRIAPDRFNAIRKMVKDALAGKTAEMVEARTFVNNRGLFSWLRRSAAQLRLR